MLNVLNFRNRGDLRIKGDVKINGQTIHSPTALAAISGYIQQEDLFFGMLKVKEHLKFQSMLRMDKTMTTEEKYQRVEEVMNQVHF